MTYVTYALYTKFATYWGGGGGVVQMNRCLTILRKTGTIQLRESAINSCCN